MDLALFFVIMSTLLQVVRIVVETIGLKMTIENEYCPEEKFDVKFNKLGLGICKYGSLLFNIFAIVSLIVSISNL